MRVINDTKCILVTRVSLFVCLSVPRITPTLLHRPGCNLGNGRGCPLVVHYWVSANSAQVSLLWQHSPNAKCQRVLVLTLCLVDLIWSCMYDSSVLALMCTLWTYFLLSILQLHLHFLTVHPVQAIAAVQTVFICLFCVMLSFSLLI